MLSSLYSRSQWGVSMPIDGEITKHEDFIFPYSELFSQDFIDHSWSFDESEDVDYLSPTTFTIILTERNRGRLADKSKNLNLIVPLRLYLFDVLHPTIGELAFVLSQRPMAFTALDYDDFEPSLDDQPELMYFRNVFLQAREVFPKNEALAWARIAHDTDCRNIRENADFTLSLSDRLSSREADLPLFSDVVRYLPYASTFESILDAIDNGIDTEIFREMSR